MVAPCCPIILQRLEVKEREHELEPSKHDEHERNRMNKERDPKRRHLFQNATVEKQRSYR